MEKNYKPSEFESRIYAEWSEKGYFHARVNPEKKPFTIIMPPPNVTGQLHMGHALNNSLQDSIIRYKRMKGFEALWMPGTDHASIATEVRIIETMKEEEGLTKADVGRENFLERAWSWTDKYGGRIIEQLKRLGCSCDWDRLAFTMDAQRNKSVVEVFVRLYREGLIYRGDRIINWCPECKTALSDTEVEFETQDSHLWHLKYPVKGEKVFITVATTRPETMLGDTAVAVNPGDKRYKDLIGKTVVLPLTGREIPIVVDSYVDKSFGTGAVKITPAHDPNDFEVGLRHKLPVLRVMNDDGTMNEAAGEAYCGLDRFAAREKVLADLEKAGLLAKTEAHSHNVGTCYRCDSTVEPIVSRQWFVKMQPLAEPAVDAVTGKKIKLVPKRFEKIYLNWMRNIRDWCISRQLWWGHRIPAYYCDRCGETVVDYAAPETCPKCGGHAFTQDPDVLDTWFSSALWPFSTLGYPDKTPELEYFYPTDVLVTAYDIIFFWVARMIFSGLHYMNEIPFSEVVFTGLVRDREGRKMSKSLGNGIDPLELIDTYGADSLRFSLLAGISSGGDMRFYEEKTESCRNFINKIWNAARFYISAAEGHELLPLEKVKLTLADKWVLTGLNRTVARVARHMDKYNTGFAAAELQEFFRGEVCDWYIELIKPALYSENPADARGALSVLRHVLIACLKMLHPVVPFVTEEIYSAIGGEGSIMVSDYPEYDKKRVYRADFDKLEKVKELIRSVRNLRAELNVPQNKRTRLFILPLNGNEKLLKSSAPYIRALAQASAVEFISGRGEVEGRTSDAVTGIAEVLILTDELIDVEKERARIIKETENIKSEIERAKAKLANESFTLRAPKNLVEAEREKLERYKGLLEKLEENLTRLG